LVPAPIIHSVSVKVKLEFTLVRRALSGYKRKKAAETLTSGRLYRFKAIFANYRFRAITPD
jgi:hypothetical protein